MNSIAAVACRIGVDGFNFWFRAFSEQCNSIEESLQSAESAHVMLIGFLPNCIQLFSEGDHQLSFSEVWG